MNCAGSVRAAAAVIILGAGAEGWLWGQEATEAPARDAASSARLDFMRKTVEEIIIRPTDSDDTRDLKIKPQPLLRYNDPARNVADSTVWRIGAKGRPTAIVTSEVYIRPDKRYQLDHEFLAIDNPGFTMQCGGFTWKPPMTTLDFQKFKVQEKPSEKPSVRLNQIKRLAKMFTLREEHRGERIELRLLPTPLDRYEPSDKPRADGAIFAGVWGVNPEVLLFIETDGESWFYAFTRSGRAKLWAVLDDVEVWNVPSATISPLTPYSNTVNPNKVPAGLFDTSTGGKKP